MAAERTQRNLTDRQFSLKKCRSERSISVSATKPSVLFTEKRYRKRFHSLSYKDRMVNVERAQCTTTRTMIVLNLSLYLVLVSDICYYISEKECRGTNQILFLCNNSRNGLVFCRGNSIRGKAFIFYIHS